MRFLLLSLTPIPGSSGEGTRVFHLARSLTRKGHDVTILTNVASHRFRMRAERHGGVMIITTFWPIAPLHVPCLLAHLLTSLWLVKRERIDVVQTESFLSGLLGLFLGRVTSSMFVADMHGPWVKEMEVGDRLDEKVVQWRLARSIERGIIANADLILVPNGEMRDALGPARDKTLVVPNGVDPVLFGGDSAREGPTDKNARREGASVLMVTGWEAWVDFDVLIEAARILSGQVKGIEFVVIGGGREEVDALARRLIGEGVRQHFRLLGRVPHEDVPAFISQADVCLALYREIPANGTLSGAMKLYEYAAMGKPIVASEFGTPPSLLREFVHAVRPGDGPALASAIQRLLGGGQDLASAAEAIRAGCAWDRMVEPYLARLQSATPSDGRPGYG